MGTKNNLEIERKFLLKKVPIFDKKISKYYIHQIYVEDNGVITRFRMTEKMGMDEILNGKYVKLDIDDVLSRKYVQCNKRLISPGVFEEIESEVTKEVFRDMCHKEHSYIVKVRRVFEQDGLKWEVDEYSDVALVTLEVELDDINQEITIPEVIKKELIAEVTGQKEFSNQSLSIKKEVLI